MGFPVTSNHQIAAKDSLLGNLYARPCISFCSSWDYPSLGSSCGPGAIPTSSVVVLLVLSVYPDDHDGRRNNPSSRLPPLRWHQHHPPWIHQKGQAALSLPHLRGRSFVQDPASAAYDPARKEEILRAYHDERASSLRGISRIFGVSRNTLTRWLKKS